MPRPPPSATRCRSMIAAEGGNFALAPHDWRYYAEKRRKAEFDLDEAEIKPYFQLDKMIEAAFETARRLFGLTFTPVDRAALSPGRARLRGEGRERQACRPVHRRLFRAQLEAFRRLDDLAARPGKARRRRHARSSSTSAISPSPPPASRRCCPSTTPARCSTNSATRCTGCCRTSPIRCSPAPRCRAISSSCPRSSTSTGWRCRRSCRNTRATAAPASRCRRRCSTSCSPRAPSTRASPRSNTHLARWSISTCTACRSRRPRRDRIRAPRSGAHPNAGGDRHAPPSAALPAPVLRRRLRGGLLLLHVVGGARRRRLRGLRGDRRRFRSGDREALARVHLRRRQFARPGGGLQGLPRPAADARCAAQEARSSRTPHEPPHRRPPPRRRLRAACGRRRGRPRHAGRRRQRHRGHARHGGLHRRGLSAHEPHWRRRLLADPRAFRPRARADGGGTRGLTRHHRALSRGRLRRDPGARAARRAHRAGRDRRLDAGRGSREGASRQGKAASCRSTCCWRPPSSTRARATRSRAARRG